MVDGPAASKVTAACDAFALGTAGFGFTFAAMGSVGAGVGWWEWDQRAGQQGRVQVQEEWQG